MFKLLPIAIGTSASTIPQWGASLVFSAVAWAVCKTIYNVYLHPLAKYPGPKLAAATLWWQAWIEVISGQSLSLELVNLHAIHGDIVRIGPNELHFSKPSVYHEIYNQKSRWHKDMKMYGVFADKLSTLTIPDYERAKKRRDITTPLFSRKNVVQMQYLVQECIEKTCANIDGHIKDGRPVDLFHAFRCCAVDVIFSICFATPLNATSSPNFRAPLVHAMHAALPMAMVFKNFPTFQTIMSFCPPSLAGYLNPELKGLLNVREMLMKQVKEVKSDPQVLADYPYRTIYHEFLKDKNSILPDLELRDEAVLFVNAGTDTASDALIHGSVRILDSPEICEKLQTELDNAWPTLEEVPRFEQLEKLPYLTAVIKEALRFSHGVVQPMTRVVPDGGAQISGEYIPGGTVVGMSNLFIHWDEEIFPDHLAFKPERWLGPEADSLDQWLVSFSKGPRSCLGINLGWCELYMSFANFFRRYNFELIDFIPADLTWKDCYLPRYEGKPISVKAKRRST